MKDTRRVAPEAHLAFLREARCISLESSGADGRPSSPYSSVHNLTSERLRVLGVVESGAGGGGGETFVNVHHVWSLAVLLYSVI
jgi:hypothetical protein